jgi:dihydrofolate reductase
MDLDVEHRPSDSPCYLSVTGSASIARALLEADLVDELALAIEPIVLGGGKTIYSDHGRRGRSSWCRW